MSVSIRKERHSHRLISETGEFVVNLVNTTLSDACDFCGVRSGATEDKFSACKLMAISAPGLKYAPAIDRAPLFMSCVVRQVVELGTHDMFIAEIVSVSVKRELINGNGKICLDRCGLINYIHGDYFATGKMLPRVYEITGSVDNCVIPSNVRGDRPENGGSGGLAPAAQCGECLETLFRVSWRKRVTAMSVPR